MTAFSPQMYKSLATNVQMIDGDNEVISYEYVFEKKTCDNPL